MTRIITHEEDSRIPVDVFLIHKPEGNVLSWASRLDGEDITGAVKKIEDEAIKSESGCLECESRKRGGLYRYWKEKLGGIWNGNYVIIQEGISLEELSDAIGLLLQQAQELREDIKSGKRGPGSITTISSRHEH